jgi:hypothetical protein
MTGFDTGFEKDKIPGRDSIARHSVSGNSLQIRVSGNLETEF